MYIVYYIHYYVRTDRQICTQTQRMAQQREEVHAATNSSRHSYLYINYIHIYPCIRMTNAASTLITITSNRFIAMTELQSIEHNWKYNLNAAATTQPSIRHCCKR